MRKNFFFLILWILSSSVLRSMEEQFLSKTPNNLEMNRQSVCIPPSCRCCPSQLNYSQLSCVNRLITDIDTEDCVVNIGAIGVGAGWTLLMHLTGPSLVVPVGCCLFGFGFPTFFRIYKTKVKDELRKREDTYTNSGE